MFFLPEAPDQGQFTSDARSETSVGTSPELRTWVAAAAGTWWAETAGVLRNEETRVRA
jgi:hypothetical protein